MTSWGTSWGGTWGNSWGPLNPLVAELQKSGVVRLMQMGLYDLQLQEIQQVKEESKPEDTVKPLEMHENKDGSITVTMVGQVKPTRKQTRTRSIRRSSTPAPRRVPQYFNARQDITPQLMDVARANAQMLEQLVQGTIYPRKKTVVKSSSRSSREEEELILLLVA